MSTVLDRVRQRSGVSPDRAAASQPRASRAGVGWETLFDAHRAAGAELEESRLPVAVAGVLGTVAAAGYRPVVSTIENAATENHLFVYDWLHAVVTFAGMDVWAPIVAAIALVLMVVAVVWTRGVTVGRAPAIVLLTAASVTAGAMAIPLVVALALAVVAAVMYVVAMIVIGIAVIAVVFLLLAGATDS